MPRLPAEILVTARVRIPAAEIGLSTAKSGGPGGQHVNKTETKVVLRWNVRGSRVLAEADRAWLLIRLAARLTGEGDLILASDGERSQSANVDAVVRRFSQVVREALHRPKKRRKTKPTRGSRERRLVEKRTPASASRTAAAATDLLPA